MNNSIILFRKVLISLGIILGLFQFLLDQSVENIICNILALITFISMCYVVVRRSSNVGIALTASIIFLNISANSLAPMMGTTLEGHPLTYLLRHPIDTFFHRGIFAICLLFGHVVAASNLPTSMVIKPVMKQLGKRLNSNLLIPANSLWSLGLVGLIAYAFRFTTLSIELKKIIEALEFLNWAPFLFLVLPYSKYKNKYTNKLLILYYIIQIIISMISNSRMGMIGPIALVSSAWLLTLFLGLSTISVKMLIRSFIYVIMGLLLTTQLTDVSTAILMERAYREERGPVEQLLATLDRFLSKKDLEDYRTDLMNETELLRSTTDNVWMENYVSNPFLERFVQIKYDDNCLDRVYILRDEAISVLRQEAIDKIFAYLPEPFLEMLEIKVDKQYINSHSTGDLIERLSEKGNIGGFLTGSIPAHAIGLFGITYPLFLFLLYYLIMSILQGIFFFNCTVRFSNIEIPTLALLLVFRLFTYISLDSVTDLTGMLTRVIWQILIFYFIALKILTFFGITIKPSAQDKRFEMIS